MSHGSGWQDHQAGSSTSAGDASTGELVARMSQEVAQLVRDELSLARAEVSGKAKRAGLGAGLFGTAGIIAWYAAAVLIATAILALALVMDAWLAALIVGVVLLAAAGVAALLGKKQLDQAGPPVPTETVESVKRDVRAVQEGRNR